MGQREADFISAWRSVTRFNGESDIELALEDPTGDTVLILIENKIKADEQARQAERYHERGAKYVEVTEVDRFTTCILAPESYRDEDIKAKYDHTVSYEQLRSWFTEQEGPRYEFRTTVIDEAITQGRKRYIKSTDEQTLEFWRFYETLAAEYPELEFTVEHTPASGTTWFRFHPSTLPDDASIVHKADRGAVDLSLGGRGERVGQLRRKVSDALDAEMTVQKTGKSASVRIEVTTFSDLSSPADSEGAIREGLDAARRLFEWEFRNRDLWQGVPRT